MRRAVVILALLAGCAHPGEPTVKTVTVDVPVSVSCVPRDFPAPLAPAPTAIDLLTAPDGAERYQMLQDAWAMNAPRLALDESVIAACQSAASK